MAAGGLEGGVGTAFWVVFRGKPNGEKKGGGRVLSLRWSGCSLLGGF